MDEVPSPVSIPYHAQETDVTCGPAAVKMVLDSLWGLRVEEASLATKLGTDAHIGTRQRVLATFLDAMGFEATVRHTDTKIEAIGQFMKSGHVIIVCYWLQSEDTDHYAVVEEIDAQRITLADPWTGPRTRIGIEDFDAAWRGDYLVPNRRDRWMLAVRVPPTDVSDA